MGFVESAEDEILCRDEQDEWQANHFTVTYFLTNYSGGKQEWIKGA
ncbi:hypothetical protein VQV38_003771 [Raoultella planticola]|nr:hypothetical protein [Raoultella planticola]